MNTATHSRRQTITTKYHGPGNVKGSRVSASCDAGKITLEWDDALNSEENHAEACKALADKMKWDADFVGGGTADGVVVWVDDSGRLKALRDFVNDYRKGSWSGNPWCKAEFQQCVRVIGASVGFHGDPSGAPTTDAEIAAYEKG